MENSILNNIISYIESLGVLIMIIPLIIVIISFIITDSKIIKILSAFCAVEVIIHFNANG